MEDKKVDIEIPNSSSDCSEWILFHKNLRKKFYNNKIADEVFLKYWSQLKNSSCVYDDTFKKYFKRKGLDLGTNTQKTIRGFKDMFDVIAPTLKIGLMAVIIGYAIYLLLPVLEKITTSGFRVAKDYKGNLKK